MSERWKISPHARQRMAERGFDRTDVLTAVIRPEVVYDGPPDHPPGRRVAKRGKIAVVFCPAFKVIVTVLLAAWIRCLEKQTKGARTSLAPSRPRYPVATGSDPAPPLSHQNHESRETPSLCSQLKYTWQYMPQVTLYLDTETDRKMRRAARAAGISRSRWVMEAIRRKLGEDWPETFMKLAGAWEDFPTAEDLRKGLGRDTKREKL